MAIFDLQRNTSRRLVFWLDQLATDGAKKRSLPLTENEFDEVWETDRQYIGCEK